VSNDVRLHPGQVLLDRLRNAGPRVIHRCVNGFCHDDEINVLAGPRILLLHVLSVELIHPNKYGCLLVLHD